MMGKEWEWGVGRKDGGYEATYRCDIFHNGEICTGFCVFVVNVVYLNK
jgi:hypothetical protein